MTQRFCKKNDSVTFTFPNLASSRSLLLVFHLQLSFDPVLVSVFLTIPTHFPYNNDMPFGQLGPTQNVRKNIVQ